jgi:protein-S-isoprenylcysteine O-methyltransferase Ste14
MMKLLQVLPVTIQISTILYLGLTGSIFPANIFSSIVFISSVLFGLWAIAEMKFRFNILPELLKDSTLVTTGPYRFVRHPMYTSIIFITLTWVITDFNLLRFIIWITLLITLNVKLRLEEKIVSAKFSEYASYKLKTKKLIPFIY